MSTTLEHWKRLVTQKHLFYRPFFTFQWTDELDARLKECIEEGLSYGRINILLGLPPNAASLRASELGIGKRTPRAATRIFTQAEIDLLNGPLATATVARRLGLSTKRVHYLRETGLWPKTTGGKRKRPSTGTASATK